MALAGTRMAAAQAQDAAPPPRTPVLIIDTDLAEAGDEPAGEVVRERNPQLAKRNIDIGNTYFKRRNYAAAISRYIEAIAWQEDSIPAREALARAYEKSGELTKAILTLQAAIEKNPESPKSREFREKIAELESQR